jgi:hypothetical protein
MGALSRRRLGAVAVVAVAAVLALVATGPAKVRPWRCHHAAERSSSREAADAYYASCWSRPNRLIAMRDAGAGSTPYANWLALDEFTVEYRHKTRFLLVGRKTADAGWRVLGSEGTGP